MTADTGHEENGIDLVDLSSEEVGESGKLATSPPPLPPVEGFFLPETSIAVEPPPPSEPSKTKIDLGEDLLDERTVLLSGLPQEATPAEDPNALEASIQNARILLNEGFPEEAKKILRQILLQNRNNVESQKLLEEIHHSELKQIFVVAEPNTRKNYMTDRHAYDDSILNVDAEKLLKSLDDEFDLGLDPNKHSIFIPEELEAAASAPSDRIDLAISFIEMELYTHANQLLRTVLRTENDSRLTAVSLLGYSHLMSGQFFEVISSLQPYINDTEIEKEDKIEFFYLMGRANSALQRSSDALGWFTYVESIDASYRDNAERIRQLKK